MFRSRCFVMMDAYSFDKDELGLEESYNAMYNAYKKIFGRLKNLPYLCTTFALIKQPRCKTERFGQRPNQIECVL